MITASLQYLVHEMHVETMVKDHDVRGLTKMLNSYKTEEIVSACEALGKLGDRIAVEPLVMVFRNPMLPVPARLAAAEALLLLESAPAVVTLLGALRRDNWQVRRNAAAVLGQLQAIWAVDPLITALEDSNQAVRRTAAAAPRRINTPDALRAADAFDEAQQKASTQQIPASEYPAEADEAPKQGTGPLPSASLTGTGRLRLEKLLPTQPLTAPPVPPASSSVKPDTGTLPAAPGVAAST